VVVVTRAAGLFPGAAVAVVFPFRGDTSTAAVALSRGDVLLRLLLGWDGVAEVVLRQSRREDLVQQADGDAGVGNLFAVVGIASPAVEEGVFELSHGAVGDARQYVSC
jgi:hypothetical protein